MGGINFRQRFFPDGKVDQESFRSAQLSAARQIEAVVSDYQHCAWQEAVGCSGSAQELAGLLEMNAMNPAGGNGISRQGLADLCQALIDAGSPERLPLRGLRSERVQILPGAMAIMSAVFSSLQIEHMTYSDGALPLGVLHDLLSRFEHHDTRDATVAQFMRRYQVAEDQVGRVERTAMALFGQLIQLDSPRHEDEVHFLRWAVSLHEIGVAVAHDSFHKHGAYIVSNADMPGFSKRDQSRLSLLLVGQRGSLQKLASLPAGDPNWRLIFCLRLAVLLHRSRDDEQLPELALGESPLGFQLDLSAAWMDANPLALAALREESLLWCRIGIQLQVGALPLGTLP